MSRGVRPGPSRVDGSGHFKKNQISDFQEPTSGGARRAVSAEHGGVCVCGRHVRRGGAKGSGRAKRKSSASRTRRHWDTFSKAPTSVHEAMPVLHTRALPASLLWLVPYRYGGKPSGATAPTERLALFLSAIQSAGRCLTVVRPTRRGRRVPALRFGSADCLTRCAVWPGGLRGTPTLG